MIHVLIVQNLCVRVGIDEDLDDVIYMWSRRMECG